MAALGKDSNDTDVMPSMFGFFIRGSNGPEDAHQLDFATEAEYNVLEIYKKKSIVLEKLQQTLNENPIQHLTLSFSGRSNPAWYALSPILPTLPMKTLRIIDCPLGANRSWIESPTVKLSK